MSSSSQHLTQSLQRLFCLLLLVGMLAPAVASAHADNNRRGKKRAAAKTTKVAKTVKNAKATKLKITATDEYSEATTTPEEEVAAAAKANKYRFEKSNLENIQELFGYDISQKDTLRISGFWLTQMRYSIPENLWKVFPNDTYAGAGKETLPLSKMDATQRFPLNARYEGFVLTQHDNPEQFYMLFYDKASEKFVGAKQTVGAEYARGIMKYKTVSYLLQNSAKQPVLTICTRSTRSDDETCTDNCFSHYRIEVRTFKNEEWVQQYSLEQTNDGDKASYDIDCTDVATKKQLQATVQSIFGAYVPKFLEAGEFRNVTATPNTTNASPSVEIH